LGQSTFGRRTCNLGKLGQAILAQHDCDQFAGFGGLDLAAQFVLVLSQVKAECAQFFRVKMLDEVLTQLGKSFCVCHFAIG
jgi:hypothetical protein